MQKHTLSNKIKSIQLYIAGVDMAHHIKGQSRHQVALLPDVLDDFVTEDNPVRVIDIFVDKFQRYCVKDGGERLYFIPAPFLRRQLTR